MLSKRAQGIKPSPTLAMDAKAKAMKAQGVDVINFGVGEPDFDTPDNIKQAAIRAINEGFTKYTAAAGIDPLKDAIIDKLKSDNSIEYTRDEVIVSCGAKHSLYNAAQALYGPGDEVIIPAPYWVSYPDQVILNDAIPVIVKTRVEDNFMLKPEALEAAITPRSKALILNYPSNPTGATYDKSALEAIAAVALKHNLYIISDEIYEKLLYDGLKHTSIASLSAEAKARTLVINGLSKSHAMTGWRIGYTAGPTDIIKAMSNIQSQSTSNPTSISQKAAVEALRGSQDFIETMKVEFVKRRNYLVDELNKIPGVKCAKPQGAFYVFPDVSALYGKGGIKGSSDMALYLLEKANVALVHGEAFGDDRYIRISYATNMRDIESAVVRMRDALGALK